ncbi:filamentous hemagglutinin N-terminal domain-containing protein [Caballeronia sp. LZ035]|uniref:two-partner secretion domain-containing protein n=1 Tax=Caballeronia sp. LZ035 TaxID=3038568 RepID=UPI002861191B|nr:filamentous hemagglutinin N-terminal domain-containing protein [Caballeronia sp. LZ035]MDR5757181.1 filamentous hemagglutinin N-terminal domain-containing protein [Caballeronia sp. LZ035]
MFSTLRAGTASPTLRLCIVTLLGAACAPVAAGPSGGHIVAGSGAIGGGGSATVIQQNSSRLAIDWNAFSTRPGESVTFNQPGANAIALNRVVGPRPSLLLGKLNANGQVFIVNPNGVIFGPGAQVNVGGLLASTLGLSTQDFMSGHYAFAANGQRDRWEHHHHRHGDDGNGAPVVNLGTLTSAPGGYVTLVGARVINAGTITTPEGVTALAAGSRVAVTLGDHSLIGLSVDQGTLHALAANHGLIQADGGQAWLTARAEDALFGSVVNNTGVIQARSAVNENGVIRLVAEGGVARVGGTLDASAPGGGNGGLVETAGTVIRVADDARITTAAASGQTGTWRIDSGPTARVGPDSGSAFDSRSDTTAAASGQTGTRRTDSGSTARVGPDGGSAFDSRSDTTAAASGQTGTRRIEGGFTARVGPNRGSAFESPSDTIGSTTLARALESSNVTINAGDVVLINGPVAWSGANTLSLAAPRGIALDAAIAAPLGTLAMSTGGVTTQQAAVTVAGLALQGATGTYMLTNASNRIGTLAADAGALSVTSATPMTVGSVAGLTGVSASGAVTLAAPSLTLAAPISSRAPGTAITLASASFDNRAGAQALSTPNGRWIVYSDSPDADRFGGLQSGNLALWGDAYDASTGRPDPRAASSTGNRFAFGALQQVTLTAVNLDVPFDTPRTLGPNDVTIALRYDGTNYGQAFADSPTVHEPFIFTVTSTGATPGAASGEYAITVTTAGGPTGYRITTQGGTLRIAAGPPPEPPPQPPPPQAPPSTPDQPPDEPAIATAATLPGILDSVRTDAANPAPLSDATPGLEPQSAPLVQQRSDSSSDGSRLPDDAWPGHVCRM